VKYVIKIRKGETAGYFDNHQPYTLADFKDAKVFESMKDARHQLNRLNGRLMKSYVSTIEPFTIK
jgi:hypothetical protein